MDGKQAASVVREYFEGISGIRPAVFQTHSITRVDVGYEVMCVYGAKYRGLVGVDGKLAKIERVDMHPGSTDVDVVPDSIIIGNLRRINARQHKQICDHCETIGGLRATISEIEERDARKTTAIDELQKTIDELKDFIREQSVVVDDRDRRIDGLTQMLVEYRKENNDVWCTLNKIASIVKNPIREDKS